MNPIVRVDPNGGSCGAHCPCEHVGTSRPPARLGRAVWFVGLWLLAVALSSVASAQVEPVPYRPAWTESDGTVVAWFYPADGLLLAMGEAGASGANLALARRAAILDAQRHVIRAYAGMWGIGDDRLEGVIHQGRVALVETLPRTVRVFYAVRLTDIELR
jgi:hypothetical protein